MTRRKLHSQNTSLSSAHPPHTTPQSANRQTARTRADRVHRLSAIAHRERHRVNIARANGSARCKRKLSSQQPRTTTHTDTHTQHAPWQVRKAPAVWIQKPALQAVPVHKPVTSWQVLQPLVLHDVHTEFALWVPSHTADRNAAKRTPVHNSKQT